MSFISPIPCSIESVAEECCRVTFTGFCLSDGTPIGLVVQDDEQVGWFNFTTAVFSPGPPPSGIGACPSGALETCIDCLTDSITACVSYDYVEDTPHISGDIGAFTLGVRNDAGDFLTGTNGDYSPFATDSAGRIGITGLGGSITVDQQPNVVSKANSTSTPLPAGGTFTGVFEEVLPFADFTVLINTDQPSAVDGFIVEYSTNGINVDATDLFTIVTAAKKQYSFGVNSRYVRIRYVNGAAPQTIFRLQTIYKRHRGKPSSHKLDESLVDNDDAELVKAILTGKREVGGLYKNVELSATNSLKVVLTDRSSEVRGRTHVDKFIENVSAFPVTIHTVTPGYIFHLMSIGVTALNSSTTVNGRLVIRDNTIVKIPYLVGQASAAPGPIAIAPAAFLEPIPFSTNVNVQQLAGVNTVSLYIVGYEEPI